MLKELHFFDFVNKSNFDFMRVSKLAFAFSGIFALIGTVAFVQILRGHANMGVDFSGGSLLQYKAEKPFTLDEVRTALHNNGHFAGSTSRR